ncbi:MAG: class I SAM-dependent methyltransferase [Candidatus Velthaea sp.]
MQHATDARSRATQPAPHQTELERAAGVLRALFGPAFAVQFSVRLWDGTVIAASGEERFALLVNAPFALRAAFLPPLDLNPGRAFAEGWLDIEGDAEAAIDAFAAALETVPKPKLPLLLARLLTLPKPPAVRARDGAKLAGRPHTRRRDAQAVGFHYDQPLAFYRAFLDPNMVYSCAYFDDGITTLAQAQVAKIDYILRKVRLQAGESLLDIGCGWGALVVRAAQHFGAKVVGITLSRAQHAEGLRRIAAAGIVDRAAVELLDYRELRDRTFDKIVSVGMVEHVGRERLSVYFQSAYRALRAGGLFLNHGIAHLKSASGYRVSGFMARHVFPDGDLLPIAAMTREAERAGFEVRDVENLREHYMRTLRVWVRNLENNREAAIAATDQRTYRIWRLYMAGSAQGFARGRMAVYQSLLAKPAAGGAAGMPATRRALYDPTPR